MAANPVNPPPFLRIPSQFLGNPQIKAYFEQQNTIIFQLWNRSGGATDDLSELIEKVNDLIEEVVELTLKVEDNTLSIIQNALAIADNATQIAINADDILKNADDIADNTISISELEGKLLTVQKVSVNYTAEPYKVVICENTTPITIGLNPSPVINELVHIKRTDGEVNILGAIDGLVDLTLNVVGYSVLLIFNGTDWSQI